MSEEIPRVIIPEKDGVLKFVQLYINGEPYFRSKLCSIYHSIILEDALREFDLNFETRQIGGINIPLKEGENYEAVGMGFGGLNKFKERRTLNILTRNSSMDYDIGFNQEHFEKIKSYFPEGLEVNLRK